MPFVSGARELAPFQLNTPVIAGRPFFEFTQHYYAILKDIEDNSKYVGFYVQDNSIVKTLDLHFNKGTGNNIVRLMFNLALLLYVDRFCPATKPSKEDVALFEQQFLIYAFAWAYSLRAQYNHLGWHSAQNYILGRARERKNSFNLYRTILASDTPVSLLSTLDNKLTPLTQADLSDSCKDCIGKMDEMDADSGVYTHYLHFLKENKFLIIQQTERANE
jgi:hypothetical protein